MLAPATCALGALFGKAPFGAEVTRFALPVGGASTSKFTPRGLASQRGVAPV